MILLKILLLISIAVILVYLLLTHNHPTNCSGVFSKCDKNNTLTLDNYNKNQKFSELRKNSKNECGLMGYSVGAQMVSRCINEFGTSSIPNSPKVSVACMISGGSLHCYEYCNSDASTERGPKGKICKKQPINYEPCWSKTTIGCCPKDLTEPRYDNDIKNYKNHPPVILTQTSIDVFADPRASYNYYEKLQKMGVDTEIITELCGNHNLFPNVVMVVFATNGSYKLI